MISNTIAYLVSRQYQRDAIFDVLSHQDGMTLPSMEQQPEAAVQRVEDAMQPPPVILSSATSVEEAVQRIRAAAPFPVISHLSPGMWTEARVDAFEPLLAEGKGALSVGNVLGVAVPLPVLYPDQTLDAALRRIGQHSFLPVVHRADARTLVGVVTMDGILKAHAHDDGDGVTGA